jgi:hypothetical protein
MVLFKCLASTYISKKKISETKYSRNSLLHFWRDTAKTVYIAEKCKLWEMVYLNKEYMIAD